MATIGFPELFALIIQAKLSPVRAAGLTDIARMTSVLGKNLSHFGSPDKRQPLAWDVCRSTVSERRANR
jgi:hypothetical protein